MMTTIIYVELTTLTDFLKKKCLKTGLGRQT